MDLGCRVLQEVKGSGTHLTLGLEGLWGSGCDLMWGQLPQLGTELFQTYLRSHCHLRSGRWGQSLLKYPRAFQFQGLHLLNMNTQWLSIPSRPAVRSM